MPQILFVFPSVESSVNSNEIYLLGCQSFNQGTENERKEYINKMHLAFIYMDTFDYSLIFDEWFIVPFYL